MRKYPSLLLFILLLCTSTYLYAQNDLNTVYGTVNRPNLKWLEANSEHFKVVFPIGYEQQAFKTLNLLEAHLAETNQLTGGRLKKLPVVLNTYNDLSNGYVTPFHFRIEVELPPIVGKSLNPSTGSWLENVIPHELVHASHAEVLPKLSLWKPIKMFAPDLVRSMNFAIPQGFTEGYAVYHESNKQNSNTGRGHYGDFRAKFFAANADQLWSLGQMTFQPDFSYPSNRHYIGGYFFTDWLTDKYGEEAISKSLNNHLQLPFLGYGLALRRATGYWPDDLYDQYEKEVPLIKADFPEFTTISTSQKEGTNEHRPVWLNNNEFIYFGAYYDEDPGFFIYSIKEQNRKRLKSTNQVADYRYSIDEDQNLWYANRAISTLYDNTYTYGIYKINSKTKKAKSVNKWGRLYAPEADPFTDRVIAIQRKKDYSTLVSFDKNSPKKINTLVDDASVLWVAIKSHPTKKNTFAVVAQKDKEQGIWIIENGDFNKVLQSDADIMVHKAAIFDPEWHPTKNDVLLFSIDTGDDRQLIEWNKTTHTFDKVLDFPFGAFEASYSPDGQYLAFTYLEGVNNRVAFVEYDKIDRFSISLDSYAKNDNKADKKISNKEYEVKDYYAALDWFVPRIILPTVDDERPGLSIASNNLLRSGAYNASFTMDPNNEQFWVESSLEIRSFFPGLRLNYDRFHGNYTYTIDRYDVPYHNIWNRVEVEMPFRFRINDLYKPSFAFLNLGVRNTSLDFNVDQIYLEMYRFNVEKYTRWIYAEANYFHKVYSRPRDVMPSSGIEFYNYTSKQLSKDNLSIITGLKAYLPVIPQYNQNLSVELTYFKNENMLYYDMDIFLPQALSRNDFVYGLKEDYFSQFINIGTRYTIPLFYPENGYVTVPTYLSAVYLTLNHNSLVGLESNHSFHLLGGGVRAKMKFGQIAFDLGFGLFYNTNNSSVMGYFGNF